MGAPPERAVAIVAVLLVAFGLVSRRVSPAEALPDTTPADPGADNPASSSLSGSLARTGVPGPDMAILGGLLLGIGLLAVRISEVRRAR